MHTDSATGPRGVNPHVCRGECTSSYTMGVPHSVYGPVEDLVHDWRFQWHQSRSPSHHRHAFMHQPDFDQTVQFRGGELQGAVRTDYAKKLPKTDKTKSFVIVSSPQAFNGLPQLLGAQVAHDERAGSQF